MFLTVLQENICIQTLKVFESGSVFGNYACLAITKDGPGKIPQITYGSVQATEWGGLSPANRVSNLATIVWDYIAAGGIYSNALAAYAKKIGVVSLIDEGNFKDLLLKAGKEDPIMKSVQDGFFRLRFFGPAIEWDDLHGFKLPLSALVTYDSYINSGCIRDDIRAMFPEAPPSGGGDERVWIIQYVNAREKWLNDNGYGGNIYRMECFKNEIARNNWNFDTLPVIVRFPHGIVNVFGN